MAQSGTWFGVSVGYPLGATVHAGVEDVAFGLDARADVAYAFGEDGAAGTFAFGVNALYDLGPMMINDMDGDTSVSPYVGAGVGGSTTGDFVLKAFVGGEVPVEAFGLMGLSVFLEGGASYNLNGEGVSFDGRLGVNYGF